jgi:hypothetical protein
MAAFADVMRFRVVSPPLAYGSRRLALSGGLTTMIDDDTSTVECLENALEDAQRKLADLAASLEALADVRAELAAVKADRDHLQKQIASLGEMQSETIVLDDADEEDTVDDQPLPSLDELMANLDSIAEADDPPAHTNSTTGLNTSVEMIAPELVFPDIYETGNGPSLSTESQPRTNSRVLVFADAKPPIKYPLYKKQTTIGRSETADISIDSQHISHVHARIAVSEEGAIVEDLASKNGIRINTRPVKRHLLRHGDVLSVGRSHFTFIETS